MEHKWNLVPGGNNRRWPHRIGCYVSFSVVHLHLFSSHLAHPPCNQLIYASDYSLEDFEKLEATSAACTDHSPRGRRFPIDLQLKENTLITCLYIFNSHIILHLSFKVSRASFTTKSDEQNQFHFMIIIHE